MTEREAATSAASKAADAVADGTGTYAAYLVEALRAAAVSPESFDMPGLLRRAASALSTALTADAARGEAVQKQLEQLRVAIDALPCDSFIGPLESVGCSRMKRMALFEIDRRFPDVAAPIAFSASPAPPARTTET